MPRGSVHLMPHHPPFLIVASRRHSGTPHLAKQGVLPIQAVQLLTCLSEAIGEMLSGHTLLTCFDLMLSTTAVHCLSLLGS